MSYLAFGSVIPEDSFDAMSEGGNPNRDCFVLKSSEEFCNFKGFLCYYGKLFDF